MGKTREEEQRVDFCTHLPKRQQRLLTIDSSSSTVLRQRLHPKQAKRAMRSESAARKSSVQSIDSMAFNKKSTERRVILDK